MPLYSYRNVIGEIVVEEIETRELAEARADEDFVLLGEGDATEAGFETRVLEEEGIEDNGGEGDDF